MSQLALFPLSMPIFPRQVIDLRIFEQRYLSLISRCLKNDEGFGVVQIREGREVGSAPQIFHFGVEVRVVDWRELEGGLLGISIQGERKFTVQSTEVRSDQLMVADITWLPDEPNRLIDERFSGLFSLCNQLREHPMVAKLGFPEPQYSSELGWQLCQLLPISTPEKVDLLSMSDPDLRLERLAEFVDHLSQGE